jgi:hypothetical protein
MCVCAGLSLNQLTAWASSRAPHSKGSRTHLAFETSVRLVGTVSVEEG